MDKITVILNVVNTGEFVNIYAEKLAIFFKCEYIAVRIYARRVNLVKTYKLVSDLIGRIAEHKHDLFRSHSYTLETDRKSVS